MPPGPQCRGAPVPSASPFRTGPVRQHDDSNHGGHQAIWPRRISQRMNPGPRTSHQPTEPGSSTRTYKPACCTRGRSPVRPHIWGPFGSMREAPGRAATRIGGGRSLPQPPDCWHAWHQQFPSTGGGPGYVEREGTETSLNYRGPAGEYSTEVPQRVWIPGDWQVRTGTVTCGDGRGWTCCRQMACKRSGVRISLAPSRSEAKFEQIEQRIQQQSTATAARWAAVRLFGSGIFRGAGCWQVCTPQAGAAMPSRP